MIRVPGRTHYGRITATVTLISASALAAHASPPRPVEPPTSSTVVERVEVPVPVDDTPSEIEQAVLAAALAAAIAAAVTKARLRRRYRQRPANAVIDITDHRVDAPTAHDVVPRTERVPWPVNLSDTGELAQMWRDVDTGREAPARAGRRQ